MQSNNFSWITSHARCHLPLTKPVPVRTGDWQGSRMRDDSAFRDNFMIDK